MIAARAVAIAALLGILPRASSAQDSGPVRHLLWLDLARLQPFAHTYDMCVRFADSTAILGERSVALEPATYAGVDAWLIVETRSGSVPSLDSLVVARDFRPLHWSSTLGPARFVTEFAGDSLLGAVGAGRWRGNVVLATRPDAIATGAMLEAMLPLLPLSATWSDSASVIAVDAASASLLPAEIGVLTVDQLPDSSGSVPVWVVALRTTRAALVYWVEQATGVPLLIQQALPPPHVGMLEFRLRRPPAPDHPPD